MNMRHEDNNARAGGAAGGSGAQQETGHAGRGGNTGNNDSVGAADIAAAAGPSSAVATTILGEQRRLVRAERQHTHGQLLEQQQHAARTLSWLSRVAVCFQRGRGGSSSHLGSTRLHFQPLDSCSLVPVDMSSTNTSFVGPGGVPAGFLSTPPKR